MVMTFSCPRFCDRALNSSGVWQTSCPNKARVLRKEWGLKYGSPDPSKAARKIVRIGVALGPTFPIEPGDFEMTAHTKRDARRRKERIVEPPKPLVLQKTHPFRG